LELNGYPLFRYKAPGETLSSFGLAKYAVRPNR
jgi:hypothetical protein